MRRRNIDHLIMIHCPRICVQLVLLFEPFILWPVFLSVTISRLNWSLLTLFSFGHYTYFAFYLLCHLICLLLKWSVNIVGFLRFDEISEDLVFLHLLLSCNWRSTFLGFGLIFGLGIRLIVEDTEVTFDTLCIIFSVLSICCTWVSSVCLVTDRIHLDCLIVDSIFYPVLKISRRRIWLFYCLLSKAYKFLSR